MIPATERRELRAALKSMVDELFKRSGDFDAVDLQRFHAQFELRELSKLVPVVARLVEERSFGHFTVQLVDRGAIRGDLFKCRLFMGFVQVSPPGETGRPSCRAFAFGPRRGVVVQR